MMCYTKFQLILPLTIINLLLSYFYVRVSCDDRILSRNDNIKHAYINITYVDPVSHFKYTEEGSGAYGKDSRLDSEWGVVVHVRTADNRTHGCTPPVNVVNERWIALVERGSCKFHRKIYNAAVVNNASAVVIYNDEQEENLITMTHKVDSVVSLFVNKITGEHIASLVDNGTVVHMFISLRLDDSSPYNSINRTSVLFVSVSFIILMMISLAWLIFYYVQRFRYAHSKDKLSKRLLSAARRAVNRMPMKVIRKGDEETLPDFDLCAICVEGYNVSDVVRVLPCKHVFHKSCVDQWLIEQRNCPMCKLDILQACGLHINSNRETAAGIEISSLDTAELLHVEQLPNYIHQVEDVVYQPVDSE